VRAKGMMLRNMTLPTTHIQKRKRQKQPKKFIVFRF
jgi:hypothetical protein